MIVATGFTVTLTVNTVPLQFVLLAVVGVTVYVAVAAADVVLASVPVSVALMPAAPDAPPVKLDPVGVDQA